MVQAGLYFVLYHLSLEHIYDSRYLLFLFRIAVLQFLGKFCVYGQSFIFIFGDQKIIYGTIKSVCNADKGSQGNLAPAMFNIADMGGVNI